MAKKLSWVITVTTAGTKVQGPSTGAGEFIIKAAPTNTGYIYTGNDGADGVSSTTGFTLEAGDQIVQLLTSLDTVWFDSSVNGEKVNIIMLRAPLEAALFSL